jgi:hypothetical protein
VYQDCHLYAASHPAVGAVGKLQQLLTIEAAMARWNSCSLVVGLTLVVACGGPGADKKPGADSSAEGTAAGSATLTGAGATFPNPIYAKWFDQYAAKTGVHINYQSIGSGGWHPAVHRGGRLILVQPMGRCRTRTSRR